MLDTLFICPCFRGVVTTVFVGKEHVFNRRFLIMADHYMVEPTACSPAAGWEKGQVEHQVQTIRGRFFQPRLKFASLEELNGWLEAECLLRTPVIKGATLRSASPD
jgi:transposase